MGKMIKALVWDVSGLPCSVGLSGDKTTAKFAGKQHKPDGLTVIPPWEARDRLKDVPVMELCGVNKGIAGFLARRGAFTLTRAALMHRSDMPNIIAPAWKPYGHRQTIVPTTGQKKPHPTR